jgi:hypothetical protein
MLLLLLLQVVAVFDVSAAHVNASMFSLVVVVVVLALLEAVAPSAEVVAKVVVIFKVLQLIFLIINDGIGMGLGQLLRLLFLLLRLLGQWTSLSDGGGGMAMLVPPSMAG